MSVAQPQLPLLSPEEYLAGEDGAAQKHEYLSGLVYAMAGGTNRHHTIAGNIFATLHARLRGKRCRPFNSDTLVRVQRAADTRFYYPDAMVVCDQRPLDDRFQDQPVVIFEVQSETTARIDRGEKHGAYLSMPTMQVYVLVEDEQCAITVWRRIGERWEMEYLAGKSATLRLDAVECEMSLAEIYEGVQ